MTKKDSYYNKIKNVNLYLSVCAGQNTPLIIYAEYWSTFCELVKNTSLRDLHTYISYIEVQSSSYDILRFILMFLLYVCCGLVLGKWPLFSLHRRLIF